MEARLSNKESDEKPFNQLTNEQQHHPYSIPGIGIGRMSVSHFLFGSLKTKDD